ncbi:hypothetical protein Droror1_Dr00017932 [Drosera rotundifolia]
MQTQTNSISRETIHSLLLAHEGRLELRSLDTPPAAFVMSTSGLIASVQTSRPPALPRHGVYNNFSGLLPTPSLYQFNPRPRGRGPGRKGGPFCQLCRRAGHMVTTCRERFNPNFIPPTFPHKPNTSRAPAPFLNTASSVFSPQAHIASSLPTQIQAAAPYATNYNSTLAFSPLEPPLSTFDFNSWLLDSGASHHVTDSIVALTNVTPYSGSQQLTVGDGVSLLITHIGNLVTPSFTLKGVLVVPFITQNLLSVFKFSMDNNCVF